MSEFKQVLVIRKDLKMGCGKACAQAAHAAQLALFEAKRMNGNVDTWVAQGYHKVVLAVNSEQELRDVYSAASSVYKLPTVLIVDFGLTQLPPNTPTAVGIGPALSEEIDKVTCCLKLY